MSLGLPIDENEYLRIESDVGTDPHSLDHGRDEIMKNVGVSKLTLQEERRRG